MTANRYKVFFEIVKCFGISGDGYKTSCTYKKILNCTLLKGEFYDMNCISIFKNKTKKKGVTISNLSL